MLCVRHVGADAVHQLRPDERIDEVHGADLHRVRARDHELEHVVGRGDAAHADDRDLHGAAALVDHPHGDRPDRRAAQAADDVGQLRAPGVDVDRHREERVDERDGVGAGVLGRPRERRDVGDVRRQLGNHRQRVTLRTALTTSCVPGRLQPNWMPPSLMFGQEMFSSSACTPSASDRMPRDLDVFVERRAADVDDDDRARARAARAAARR